MVPSHSSLRSNPCSISIDTFSGPFPGTTIAVIRIIASADIVFSSVSFDTSSGDCT
jgi:hypothetical protein